MLVFLFIFNAFVMKYYVSIIIVLAIWHYKVTICFLLSLSKISSGLYIHIIKITVTVLRLVVSV